MGYVVQLGKIVQSIISIYQYFSLWVPKWCRPNIYIYLHISNCIAILFPRFNIIKMMFRVIGYLWPVNSPHKGHWRGALMFSLISALLSKQWWGWWFETSSCPLWRHRNDRVVCSHSLSDKAIYSESVAAASTHSFYLSSYKKGAILLKSSQSMLYRNYL